MNHIHHTSILAILSIVLLASENLFAQSPTKKPTESIRFATFNISFYRSGEGQLQKELQQSNSRKPAQIAEIIQRVRPDVILLNEFDYDSEGKGIEAFQKNYLGKPQGQQKPIKYEFVFLGPVNTGVDTKMDLDGDGKRGTGNDCFGFGRYPGQYGMVVLSKYPIDREQVRTFQKFLWKDMPNHLMPTKIGSDESYYSKDATAIFRLSSKSHWDVPIRIDNQTYHFLVAHPTPPVFDKEEDRNGRRNHDEIRMFADYVSPGKASYLYDDRGHKGGLKAGETFVIAGDMNADPFDGDSSMEAARQLTEHPWINNSVAPKSNGGMYYAIKQGEKNLRHKGPAASDTGDFRDSSVGNLRLDYCLPSKNLKIVSAGVFWPKPDQPGAKLVTATDHRLVWVDVKVQD